MTPYLRPAAGHHPEPGLERDVLDLRPTMISPCRALEALARRRRPGHSTTVVVPRRFQHTRVRRHSRAHDHGTERLHYARIGCDASSWSGLAPDC